MGPCRSCPERGRNGRRYILKEVGSFMDMKWICHPSDNRESRLVPVFQRTFAVRDGLKAARLSITAHGIYEAALNGRPVTDNKFVPGLTSYYHRIQVQRYDVTALIQEGENLWRTTVGDGWWRWNNNFDPGWPCGGSWSWNMPMGRKSSPQTSASWWVQAQSSGAICRRARSMMPG